MGAPKGVIPWNKGKKNVYSKEHIEILREASKKQVWDNKRRKIMSEAMLKLFDNPKNHPRWKGGKSYEIYPEDWTDDSRDSIRKRDNYICQECGLHQDELKGRFKKLDIHHIDYDKDNLNPNNLITLCRSCHIKTNGNREYWTNYFNNK